MGIAAASEFPAATFGVGQNPQNSYGSGQHEKTAIFIDGANLFYSAMQLDIEIDYIKLLQHLTQNRRLVRAYFYTGVDSENEKQQGFLHWMRCHGYRVVTKELIHHSDGTHKANLDVEIAVDMLTLSQHCNTVILVSGDGDLTYALDNVAYQGVRVEVVSLRSMTSDSLINIADRYTDLDTIQTNIQKGAVNHPAWRSLKENCL